MATLICPKCGDIALEMQRYLDGRMLFIHGLTLGKYGRLLVRTWCFEEPSPDVIVVTEEDLVFVHGLVPEVEYLSYKEAVELAMKRDELLAGELERQCKEI